MKCPVCKIKVNELDNICPNCKTNFEEYEKEIRLDGHNAQRLEVMAYIILILSIIGVIFTWINAFYIENLYTTNPMPGINWISVTIGFAILIVGLTLFFLLKTVVDIYRKVEK